MAPSISEPQLLSEPIKLAQLDLANLGQVLGGVVYRALNAQLIDKRRGVGMTMNLAEDGNYATVSASAVARISSPESSSLSVTVNGGAMRKIPPIPGSWTMFMCRPCARQDPVTA